MICPNCKTNLPNGSVFCSRCGARTIGKAPAKNTSVGKLIAGFILLILGGIGLISAAIALFQGDFDESGIVPLLVILLLFFGGLKLVKNNRSTQGSYHSYSPHFGYDIHWVPVCLLMYFFFPAGLYLLIKKMGHYQSRSEALRNSRTLKKWAVGFLLVGAFLFLALSSILSRRDLESAFPAFLILFGSIAILLLYKSHCLTKVSQELSYVSRPPVSYSPPASTNTAAPASAPAPAQSAPSPTPVSTPAQSAPSPTPANPSYYASSQGGSVPELLFGIAALLLALLALFT